MNRAWLLLLFVLSGCASARPAGPADLPDDFALGITTLPVKGVKDPVLAPAWYLVQPDDTLRIAAGERLPGSPVPPIVRTLTRQQVRRLWEMVSKTGLSADPPPGNVAAANQVSADFAIAIVYVSSQGNRRTFSVPNEDVSHRGAVAAIVSELRGLGWVPEALPPPDTTEPTKQPKNTQDDLGLPTTGRKHRS